MTWQDATMTVGGAGLFALLIPTLFDVSAHVPITSSGPIAIILLAFAAALGSNGMKGGAVTCLLQSAAWIAIAVVRS